MKKGRKGFTITELVIVIVVIAILAAVLIPTFGSVIKKANQSSALQEVKAAYSVYLSEALTDSDDDTPAKNIYVVHENGTVIVIVDGQCEVAESAPTGYVEHEIVANTEGDQTLKVK